MPRIVRPEGQVLGLDLDNFDNRRRYELLASCFVRPRVGNVVCPCMCIASTLKSIKTALLKC